MAQRRHVSLPKSSVSGQTPSPENLYYGEVAVNYFSGDEFLSIKNTSGNIVTFRTEQYYKEKELVVSSALNDLNDRTSALGDRVTTLENSAPDMSNYATTAVTNALRTDLNITAVALNDLNDRTSALGDRVTTLENSAPDMSNYATTAVTDALRTDLNTVSGDVETLSGEVETLSGEVETLSGAVESNAHVTAAALVDLGGRVTTLENSGPDMSNYATTAVTDALRTNLNTISGDVETLSGTVEENERVTAAALNDINTRLNTVSGNIETNYYTKTQVDNAISSIDTSLFRVVTTLPDSDIDEDKIYLIQSETSGANNVYIEYAYVNNDWEKLGEYKADVDLSAYAFKADVEALSGTVGDNERVTAEALYKLNSGLTETKNSLSGYATTAVTTALRNDVDAISGTVSGLSDTYYAKVNDLTLGLDEENKPIVKLDIKENGETYKSLKADQSGFVISYETDGVDEHYNEGWLGNDEIGLAKREYFEGDTTTDEALDVWLNHYDGLHFGRGLINNATHNYEEQQNVELTRDKLAIKHNEWDNNNELSLNREAKLETSGLTLDSFEDGADEWINNITTVNSEGFKVVDRANPSNILFGIDRNGVDFYASEYTSLGRAALPIHYRKTWAELTTRNEVGNALNKKYDKVSGLTLENSGITFVEQEGSATATTKYTNSGITLSVKDNGTVHTLFNLNFIDGTIDTAFGGKIISELVESPDLDSLRTEMEEYVDEAISAATSGGSASLSNGVATVKHTNVANVESFSPTYAPYYNTAITQAELVSLLKSSGGTLTKKDELMHVVYDDHGHITLPSVTPLIIDDYADSASTNPISNRAVTQVILDNELVVSAALNDLNDKKLDASAYTTGDYASQSDLETLSGTVTAHTANTTVHVSAAEKTAWNDKVDVSALSNYHEKTAVSGLNINALTSGNQAQEVFRIGNSLGAAITVSGIFNSVTKPTNVSVSLEGSAGLHVSGGNTDLADLDVRGDLNVSGATKINNNLTVTGNTSVSGTVGVKSTLNVSGATKISNNLTVTGNASVSGTVQSTGVITASAGVKYGTASNYGPWKIWKGTQAEYNSQTPSASDTICIIVSQ